MVDKSMTGTFQINLPKDLLSEARRQPKPKNEQLKVEGWRTLVAHASLGDPDRQGLA